MNHTSLTTQYRPQIFSEVMGQAVACKILSKASKMNMVAPAYILSGTRGVGKTTLARIFAKALNCLNAPVAEPCNECVHCKKISKGSFVDVIELDAASNRSIDDIRELRNAMQFAPMEGRYKVFILDEAHMLTKEAYNALLKSLEEPPKNTVFILASTDVQKFPITIVSRCQHLVLRSMPMVDLVQNMKIILEKEGIQYEEQAIMLIAQRASGSMRDALSLLGQCLVLVENKLMLEQVEQSLGVCRKEVYYEFLYAINKRDMKKIVFLVNTIQEEGIDIRFFLQEFTQLWRNLFLLKRSGEEAFSLLSLPEEEGKKLLKISKSTPLAQIHASWQMVLDGQKRIIESLEPGVALELLLLNISALPELLNIEMLSSVEEEVLVQKIPAEKKIKSGETEKKNFEIKQNDERKFFNNKNSIRDEDNELILQKEKVQEHIDDAIEASANDIQDDSYSNENIQEKNINEENTSLEVNKRAKLLFAQILENDKKFMQYRTMYIGSYEFVGKECIIYPSSERGHEKLLLVKEDMQRMIYEHIGEYAIVFRKASDALEQIKKKITEHPVVALLEKEFSTTCEYTVTPMKYKK